MSMAFLYYKEALWDLVCFRLPHLATGAFPALRLLYYLFGSLESREEKGGRVFDRQLTSKPMISRELI